MVVLDVGSLTVCLQCGTAARNKNIPLGSARTRQEQDSGALFINITSFARDSDVRVVSHYSPLLTLGLVITSI